MTRAEKRMERLCNAESRYNYDPETGDFTKKSTGELAGYFSDNALLLKSGKGVHEGAVSGTQLAWYMLTGEDPNADGAYVCHDDNDPHNHKWTNLKRFIGPRDLNPLRSSGSSEFHGVVRRGKKWLAMLYKTYIGSFDTPYEAKLARAEAHKAHMAKNFPGFKYSIEADDLI